jgi:alanyl aminopeptidase
LDWKVPSAIALLLALAPAANAQNPAPPSLRLDPALAVPIRTALEVTVIPDDDTFEGKAAIDLDVKKPTSVIWLNAAELDVHGGRLNAGGKTSEATVLPGGSDFVGFQFARPIPPGKATLAVAYKGVYEKTDTTGFFKQQDGGAWYVFSQMEPTDARRAFPCFDEPNYKTPWQVTLHVKKDHVALSNTPVASETDEPNGMKAVIFKETAPLPSYLIAIGVGPFELVDAGTAGQKKTPLRIVAPKGRGAEAAYAADVTGEILSRLETYFGIPYPYEKLDSLAIPQTVGFGAMENVGLITYVDRRLLIRPDMATEEQRRGYASTGAHEIAHQWFGDLVTMQWWNDLWLNEGFATWMANRTLEDWKPEWGGALAKVERRADVMVTDRLISARRVRQPIENEGDIRTAFDGITYQKGASLLAMYEEWMGREAFRKGIQRYLKAHSFGNATSSDFLGALAEEGGKEVAPSFASFLDQPGAPVLSVELACAAGKTPTLKLTQKRFLPLGSPGSPPMTWQIPVRVRYAAGGKQGHARTILAKAEGELALTGAAGCPDWMQANDSGLGYYLVAYQGGLLAKLLHGGAPQLTTDERVGLLGDARLLTTSGDLEVGEVLAELAPFALSPERQVVEATIEQVRRLREMVSDPDRPRYAALVQRLFGDRARALGWAPAAADDGNTRLLRPKLVSLVADEGEDAELRAEAVKLADSWLADRKAVDPEVVSALLGVAARNGGPEMFDRFLAAAKQSTDRRDRRRLLSALGKFTDPALVDRALGLILTGGFDIRESQELIRGINSEPAGRAQSFEWLQQNYDLYAKTIPKQMVGRIPQFAVTFCDDHHRSQVESFFKQRNIDQYDGGGRTLAQTLESIQLCSAFKSAQAASLQSYLEAN